MEAVVLGIFLSLLKMEKIKEIFNLFMHNVEKWPNTLLKFCSVNTVRYLKYVWLFLNIIHERVNVKVQTYLAIESPLKMMKNVFYFILKSLLFS